MGRPPNTEERINQRIYENFEEYCKQFIKIVDNAGEEVPFVFNAQQREFYKDMGKFNLIAKSRAIGFSTLALAYSIWLANTRPHVNCLLVSYNVESTQALFNKLKMMYESIPEEHRTPEKRNNRQELFLENKSRISCKTISKKPVGRSQNLTYAHLSEFAFYGPELQEQCLVSLESAMNKSESSVITIETTSNGYNFYQELATKAQKGQSKYKFFFFPWYCEATQKQFKHDIDEAETWFKSVNSGKRLNPGDLEKDEIELQEKYGISLRLLMYRRYRLQDMSLEDWHQEMPTTLMESFKNTQKSIFDTQMIFNRLNYLLPPLKESEITKELPQELEQYLNKSLFFYENVAPNERYYLGVDSAAGGGGDLSAISVFASDGNQVATFYNNKIPVYKFTDVVDLLGHYFNYGFLVVEKNNVGIVIIEKLRVKKKYLNMYKMKIFDESGRKRLKVGWVTTTSNKTKLVEIYKEQFELGLININSKETLEEMLVFQNVNGKMSAKRGKHDCIVIASCLAQIGMMENKWYV